MSRLAPPDARETQLLERDSELSAMESALAAAGVGHGSVVIIEGEAGIGKTTLLDRAAAEASRAGMLVLRAAATELEQPDPYGVAASLFAPALRPPMERRAFRGAAERARAVLEPNQAASLGPADAPTVRHAMYWLALNLAETSPLVLMVDDAQWVDDASARLLSYLGHRVHDAPIAILLAFRPLIESEPASAVRSTADATYLTPAPLTEAAVSRIADTLGVEVDAGSAARICQHARGNPFYVKELLRAAATDGVEGLADDAIALPDSIRRSIAGRLGPDTSAMRRTAEATAVLGDNATLDHVARVAGLELDDVANQVRRLTQKRVLEPDRLSFSHPIVRSVVYAAIPAAVRSSLHRSAAHALYDAGVPASAVASQLLTTEPGRDGFVVRTMREAASAATAQGDPAAAVTFLKRAVADSAVDELGSTLFELAIAEAALGDPVAADRFDEAVRHTQAPMERARIRLAQGHALITTGRWADAVPVFAAGLDDVGDADVPLKSRLEAGLVSSSFIGVVDPAAAERRLADILAKPLTDPALRELAAWTAFQQATTLGSTAIDAAQLARRAVDGAPMDSLVLESQVIELAAGVLVASGDLDEEIDLLNRALDEGRRASAYGKVAIYSYCRALPHLLAGNIADATADAQTAIAAEEHGWSAFYSGACAALTWSLIESDQLEAARHAVSVDDDRWRGQLDYEIMIPIARGRIRLVTGDAAGAAEQFELTRSASALMGIRSTAIIADWRTWHAVALHNLGRHDEALRSADECLEMADQWGDAAARAHARWAAGIVQRDAGIPLLRDALELVRNHPARLIRARVGLALGRALRRAGMTTEARAQLAMSAELAARLGANWISNRAREELTAAGARPRRIALTGVESLTPSELRVARMAAAGRTNREVAQALFVTPKAVEYHLANVYRKLAIRGRVELAGALEPTREAASV